MTFKVGDWVRVIYKEVLNKEPQNYDGVITSIRLDYMYPYYVETWRGYVYPWKEEHLAMAGPEHIKTKEEACAYLGSLMRTKK